MTCTQEETHAPLIMLGPEAALLAHAVLPLVVAALVQPAAAVVEGAAEEGEEEEVVAVVVAAEAEVEEVEAGRDTMRMCMYM